MLLLTLLGEQPIPNLVPLWQHPHSFHAVQFAATAKTLPVAEELAKAIQNDPQIAHITIREPLVLDAYDLQQCRRQIARTITDCESADELVSINLTGGTKIMCLAAMLAAFGTSVPLIYVSTETSELIHYRSDGTEQEREPLHIAITVEQYLKAHGLEVSNNSEFNPHLGEYEGVDKGGDKLELRIKKLLAESGLFDDVRRGVHIRKHTRQGEVKNELDIMVTSNGNLAVCSCKSGKKVEKDVFYELSSLSSREKMGIYCGKVLCLENIEISEAMKARAESEGVKIVFGDKIEKIADVMLSTINKNAKVKL